MKKVCIIGAGASGLAAAIAAAREGAAVTVYEHGKQAVAKLRLTGNGKCNFTNRRMGTEFYHTDAPDRLESFLRRFGTDEAIGFLKSLGVGIHERFGYCYPEDDRAATVADALTACCIRLGVDIRYGCEDFYPPERLFHEYDSLILSTGGRSYKKTGSNGTGYRYPEALGIRYSWIMPALTVMEHDDAYLKKIAGKHAGKRIIAGIKLYETDADGRMIFSGEDTGELQIGAGTISGIPVMNLSGAVSDILHRGMKAQLCIDFHPDESKIPEIVAARRQPDRTDKEETDAVRTEAGTCFADGITGGSSDQKNQSLYGIKTKHSGLNRSDMIRGKITADITGTGRIDRAQVVRGGVGLSQLNENLRCISSPVIPPDREVYVTGELCDVDGICGGYNLHWAWTSGCIAGAAAGI